jgi:hypothetical protein
MGPEAKAIAITATAIFVGLGVWKMTEVYVPMATQWVMTLFGG